MIDASTRLRRAILLNDILLVKRIVRNNPQLLRNPDLEDRSNTSLHLAAKEGFVEIAEHLINSGHEDGEIALNTDHCTPLHLAAQNGHVEVGRLIIQRFPRCISYKTKDGLDALSIAAQHPASTSLIPVLLSNPEFPADVEERDAEGNTPLHHASASGSLKALRILLSAGANPMAKNSYDWTPLAYSQTVAAEVYFKNLVAEFERKKVEGARLEGERERQRAAGVRLVDEEGGMSRPGEADDDEMIGDALKRQWSPVERRRAMTPTAGRSEGWMGARDVARARAGSGD